MFLKNRWVIVGCLALTASAAQLRMPDPPRPLQRMGGMQPSAASHHAELVRAAQRRQELIRADVNKLVQIGTTLQLELAKAPAGTISAESLKHSEELEKLAKRLKKELHGEM
jgi:hypothetical protein